MFPLLYLLRGNGSRRMLMISINTAIRDNLLVKRKTTGEVTGQLHRFRLDYSSIRHISAYRRVMNTEHIEGTDIRKYEKLVQSKARSKEKERIRGTYKSTSDEEVPLLRPSPLQQSRKVREPLAQREIIGPTLHILPVSLRLRWCGTCFRRSGGSVRRSRRSRRGRGRGRGKAMPW
ncbi:hypothetical protein BT69DRAFT_807923 [Atractiella rhizophila]|nr:hypothetical protein BT69DRAFT_807923 [Atractiella rhizophila]